MKLEVLIAMHKTKVRQLLLITIIAITISACGNIQQQDLKKLKYTNEPYIKVNSNVPQLSKDEISTESFEQYSDLDELGRCGVAVACIGKDIMPTEERGAIGQVKPTGWHLVKYDIVDGKYLYNRCHLIGYQLTGENANEKNLITGTRSMNVDGMLPFENMVANYINKTDNHVMYRVTPIYYENDLLAKGVQMEALSVEDNGAGVSFNVFVFNAQQGIEIDYSDGSSKLIEDDTNNKIKSNTKKQTMDKDKNAVKGHEFTYVLNTNTRKIHLPDCPSVADIKAKNKKVFKGTKEELLNDGYTLCDRCKP